MANKQKLKKVYRIPKDKEEWWSLGIHQGESTKERSYEVTDLLRKHKIPCDITSCDSLGRILFFPIWFLFPKQYFACVPNEVLFWKALEILDNYDYNKHQEEMDKESYIYVKTKLGGRNSSQP